MKRAAWLRKSLWILFAVLILLAGGSLIALRFYLSSAAAVRQVAERLQQMLGGRVEIQSAEIGLIGDSSVRGIEVYADGEANKPWLRLDDVVADLSVFSLLRDQSPQDIHLQGARLRLRFDSDGRLLTKLPTKKKTAPERLPSLHIENGELTFDQEHRSPMIIRGVRADLSSSEKGMMLTGTVSDPFWGNWKANGDFNSTGSQGSIALDTESAAVTMTKLKSIPFVPMSVWQEIQVEGTTPAQLRLDVETKDAKTSVHYRVEISPRDAHVRVPSIDLEAVQANGKAVIADEIVELENVHGKTAGGSIAVNGKLNFHDEPTVLNLKAGVQDVVLHDLPRSWKLPSEINGKLTGSADLVVTIKKGKAQTAGSGEGVVQNARWGGFALKKPVRLALRSENGRFRFHRPKPEGGAALAPRVPASGFALAPQAMPGTPIRANYPGPILAKNTVGPAPPVELQNATGQFVNLLDRGIKLAADGLSTGIDAAATALGKLKPPSKPGEEPTYLDLDLNLQNVDLAKLVKKLKLDLPYALTGRLTFQVHASIPINTAGNLKAYRLRGNAKMASFKMAGLAMTNVEAKVRYANGVLDLENLSGQMPQANEVKSVGKFDGNARVEVVPRGDLQASLKLDRIPLETLLQVYFGASSVRDGSRLAGVLSGTVQARAPLLKLGDPASWRGTANLNLPSADVFGIPLRNAVANLIVDETRARLSTFKADVAGEPLTGQGEVQLQGAFPFKAEAHVDRGDLSTLHGLTPALRPPFELKGRTKLDGTATGTLKPFRFDTNGKLHARDLVVERFAVEDLSLRWSREKDDLKLDAIEAQLYGGSVTGSARLPLDAAAPGDADLNIRKLDVQAMAKALPGFPVRLEGKVSGTVKGKLTAAEGGRRRSLTSDIEVTAPQLRVQGIPAEKLKGTLDYRTGKTTYNLQGETLGGTFSIKGDLPSPATEEKKKASEPNSGVSQKRGDEHFCEASLTAQIPGESDGTGRFELRNAHLSRVWRAFNISEGLAHLRGRFSLSLNYRHIGPNRTPIGEGSFQIVNIRWDDDYLGTALQGGVALTASALRLDNVTGDVANGLFLGRFLFGLAANSRSWFRIDLQQVEASRLLAPLPAVAPHIKGPVDVNLRGNIGRDWDGSGGITLTRCQIYGLSITQWRIPLTFSFTPAQGSGELTARDSEARLGQGRAHFEGTLNWGNGLRLVGKLLYYNVDLRTLLRSAPEVSSYASGRVSGRIDLSGSEMRSLNDLKAVVQAKMRQGQALQMPVLRQITPYLRPGSSSATFQSGEMKGRLAGGIFRIEHATLVGDFIKLLILGTVNLAGNLNLEVTAQTGLYVLNRERANSLSSRIPLIGAIPRLLLYEANTLLAAAVVHLRVTGNYRAPVVRLEPLVMLTEESIRFFLGRALGLSIPNVP